MPAVTGILPLSQLLLATFLHFIWQATVVILILAVLRSLFPPQYARIRYGLAVLQAVVLASGSVVETVIAHVHRPA